MASTRTYGESCALAHGLDLVGERWALLVVRELLFGPRRFTDIQERLPGASSSVLTDRLHQLVEAGVVERRRLPRPAASRVYELTEWGQGLRPVMVALSQWALTSELRAKELPTTPAALAMSLLVRFDPARTDGADITVDLDLDGDMFRAEVHEGAMTVGPPDDRPAEARIRVGHANLKAMAGPLGGSAQQLAKAGIFLEGDADAAIALLRSLGGSR